MQLNKHVHTQQSVAAASNYYVTMLLADDVVFLFKFCFRLTHFCTQKWRSSEELVKLKRFYNAT